LEGDTHSGQCRRPAFNGAGMVWVGPRGSGRGAKIGLPAWEEDTLTSLEYIVESRGLRMIRALADLHYIRY
jgi:hypothetical protein